LILKRLHVNRKIVSLNKDSGQIREPGSIKKPLFLLNRISEKIGFFFGRSFGSALKERYDHVLIFFEENNSLLNFDIFLGYKLITGFISGLIAALAMKTIFFMIPGVLIFCIAGFFIPDYFLKRAITKKMNAFEKDLPYTIDLLYIATLSGQNIFNSIKILTEKYTGSLSIELGRFLKQIKFGVGRTQAYKNALARNNTESFKNLLFLLIQAEKFGSKISGVLRQKSKYLRFELAQKSEVNSRKTSILLIFPLVFLILPAFVLLVGGPLIFTIAGGFNFY
jgi:pilus assembly protein TadC